MIRTTKPTINTTQLHYWLAQYRAGDAAAADSLLRASCGRLETLARKMLDGPEQFTSRAGS
jgi:hypothetical protein